MSVSKTTLSGINPPETSRFTSTNTVLPDAAVTVTPYQLAGGLLSQTPTAARIITLPTAAEILGVFPGLDVAHGVFVLRPEFVGGF